MIFDYVVTSGGIGPTEDDVTYEGVAKAFGVDLKLNDQISAAVESFFGKKDSSDAIYRLANIPSNSKLVWNPSRDYPIVTVENVFILPGVPQIFEKMLPLIEDQFKSTGGTSEKFTRYVYIDKGEMTISNEINAVFKKFQLPEVQLGSYPSWTSNYYKTKFTIDALSEQLLDDVENYLSKLLPEGSIRHDIIDDPIQLLPQSVYNFDSDLVKNVVSLIEKALQEHGPNNVVLSFNGGKDCTLLLHMYEAVLRKHFPTEKANLLFIETAESFEELENFIEATKKRYSIGGYYHIKSSNIIEGLKKLNKDSPNIYAIILGTRSTDPGGKNAAEFQPCDPQYGNFLRVNPILNWRYSEVWNIIRTLQIPYCILYDQGYTSLGSKSRTKKNPELFVETIGKRDVYNPAYLLKAEETERCSRD
ncbi:FAD synthase-like [Symsagittifera roscoffensis]|uniref:FAD synthase-like n=1 Tax=Symsagittifera roscoffensis TaxID=84072 RepID=UPI00307B1DA5